MVQEVIDFYESIMDALNGYDLAHMMIYATRGSIIDDADENEENDM